MDQREQPFYRENFRGMLKRSIGGHMARPNFMEKTFAGGFQTPKLVKVFSFEKFLLYGISQTQIY